VKRDMQLKIKVAHELKWDPRSMQREWALKSMTVLSPLPATWSVLRKSSRRAVRRRV
jgi:hypothetical protein